MSLLGVHLTLLDRPDRAGAGAAAADRGARQRSGHPHRHGRPASSSRSTSGRGGPLDSLDYPLLDRRCCKPSNRVIMIATFGAVPRVLMDGIITHQQLPPGDEPGQRRRSR